MQFIAIILRTLTHAAKYHFCIHFPAGEIETRAKTLALEHLNRTNSTQNGITWANALENISDDLWEKHGFCRLPDDSAYPASCRINKYADAFLIPPKGVRLMEASVQMVMYLLEYLHPELCGQSPPGLWEKIYDFVLIWAPRFVDENCHDLPAFIEDALDQLSLTKVISER